MIWRAASPVWTPKNEGRRLNTGPVRGSLTGAMRRNDAPRRYLHDAAGQRVVLGLTVQECLEFEQRDGRDYVDQAEKLGA